MSPSSTSELRSLYAEYRSVHPRPEPIERRFCEAARALLDADGLRDETYEVQICNLYEYCEQSVEAGLVAKAVGCSASYARRFSYDSERGAYQKDWSKSTQNQKVSPGTRTKIIDRDRGACLRCRLAEPDELEVHHITPVSQGGTNDDSNLATLCSDCHRAAHGGSKTAGRTAYSGRGFREWLHNSARLSNERDLSCDSKQSRLSDYRPDSS